jgi:hypothetical protein
MLATALLYYYATPWIKLSWSSRDIKVYRATDQLQDGSFACAELFIDVTVRRPEPESQNISMRYPPFVQNPLLFSLGVMLLEIAFGMPLRAMRRSVDLEGNRSEHITDFNTAFR